MAEIEAKGEYIGDDRIRFNSKEAGEHVRYNVCWMCPLHPACSGPDEKTGVAVIHDSIGIKHSDEQILNEASCLKQK
jgi:hypothetical protein